jgi:HlyD family secretion protein
MKMPDIDVQSLLGSEAVRPRWRRGALWLLLALLLLALALAALWLRSRQAASQPRYVTEPAARGRLVVTVTANGTLQPPTRWTSAANCQAPWRRCEST